MSIPSQAFFRVSSSRIAITLPYLGKLGYCLHAWLGTAVDGTNIAKPQFCGSHPWIPGWGTGDECGGLQAESCMPTIIGYSFVHHTLEDGWWMVVDKTWISYYPNALRH